MCKYCILGQYCHAMLHGCQKSSCSTITEKMLLGGLLRKLNCTHVPLVRWFLLAPSIANSERTTSPEMTRIQSTYTNLCGRRYFWISVGVKGFLTPLAVEGAVTVEKDYLANVPCLWLRSLIAHCSSPHSFHTKWLFCLIIPVFSFYTSCMRKSGNSLVEFGEGF